MTPLRKIDTVAERERGDLRAASRARVDAEPLSLVSQAGKPVTSTRLFAYTVLLSGVAGYVDAAGFVLLLGFFPAHLTGELVGDAIALASGQLAARSGRLWLLPVFVVSVVLAALVARLLRARGRAELTGLLGLLTASLALFSACDSLAHLFHEAHLPLGVTGGCAVAAMGFQTALLRESLSGSCPTTVMTGNLVQVITDLVDHVFNRAAKAESARVVPRSRLMSMGSALLAFVCCATLGGWLTRHYGTPCVLVPTSVAAVLTARAWLDDRKPLTRVSEQRAPSPFFTYDDLWPEVPASDDWEPLAAHDSPSATRIKVDRAVPSLPCPKALRKRRRASGTRRILLPRDGA